MSNRKNNGYKYLFNMGDRNFLDYDGLLIYQNEETGGLEGEKIIRIELDEDELGHWEVYRFSLDKCTFINGILSDNRFHPEHAAWFATPEEKMVERPQDATYLSRVVEYCDYGCYHHDEEEYEGLTPLEMIQKDFCSDNPMFRAWAYQAVYEYHGWDEADQYKLEFYFQKEMEKRYEEELSRKE